jgi:SAM-dependent methyltransferase
VVWLFLAVAVASVTSGPYTFIHTTQGEYHWSPYYRINYTRADKDGNPVRGLAVNQIGHQRMRARDLPIPGYALPHLLNRDCGRSPFRRVLVIGAGSGNDVSRALQFGAEHVDAVEIDPALWRYGATDHPDRPYQDPRVHAHFDDGRNFLRTAPDGQYDLILYAVVDSLVLHSGYSNLRLESYLFTREAFADVRRCLKPDGWLVMTNGFRQGWIVARIQASLRETFGQPPVVFALPYVAEIRSEAPSRASTMFVAGYTPSLASLRTAFERQPEYWVNIRYPLSPDGTPNGFTQRPATELPDHDNALEVMEEAASGHDAWMRIGPARVESPAEPLRVADDDWPFLYLRKPMLPDVTWRGMAVMGGLTLLLLMLFRPTEAVAGPGDWGELVRMFFLGAGFMLIETRAVVHMALLFGSTWMVNTVVFAAVLGMILLANLYVGVVKPKRLGPYYALLFAALAANFLIPLETFLGWGRMMQTLTSTALVFAPIACAGVVFAVSFVRSSRPDRAFGANIAGALAGGLAENCSLILGFRYLVLVASAFYLLSAVGRMARSTNRNQPSTTGVAGADGT